MIKTRVLPFVLEDGQWKCRSRENFGKWSTLYFLKKGSKTPSENGKLVQVSISSDEVSGSTEHTVVPCQLVKEEVLSLSGIVFNQGNYQNQFCWERSGDTYRVIVSVSSKFQPTSEHEICACTPVSAFEEGDKSVVVVEIRERIKKMKKEEGVGQQVLQTASA